MSSVVATFSAAIRSVGTAATMASVGFYMHRRDYVTPAGKRILALLSQQVTIPAFLFAKIIYCPQHTDAPCPSVTDNLGDVWMLLIWPLFVVGCGLLVGDIAAHFSSTPPRQRRSVLAACAFANSTGLPITLLTTIHANFPESTELGRVDPTIFLSVYLLLYPVLQWGIGGWLLAPQNEDDGVLDGLAESKSEPIHIRHVLNMEKPSGLRKHGSQAEMLVKELSFTNLHDVENPFSHEEEKKSCDEDTCLLPQTPNGEATGMMRYPSETGFTAAARPVDDIVPLTVTLHRVAQRSFQPPVVGAFLGMVIASVPKFRGVFVDLYDRDDDAPLEWLFDGIYAVGQAAVPVNMTILGINLSNAMRSKSCDKELLSPKAMAAVVVAKMLAMPMIGVMCAIILKNYVWNIPHEIDGSFYLVLMIVFITPTANNVMVMVELSGSASKEGMARLISWQYAVAPVLLSLSVAVVVGIASQW